MIGSASSTIVLVAAQINIEFQNHPKSTYFDDCSAIANISKKSLLQLPVVFEDLNASIRLVSRTYCANNKSIFGLLFLAFGLLECN
ncbi:hypothetical protein C7B70_09915 [Chlorogloea sp. CCALA 695]|nr:hypothetical protein C7B70_09915 [Chlorogloea sp. CCALA 695]